MAKVKPLKDEKLDPIEEVQEYLEEQSRILHSIQECLTCLTGDLKDDHILSVRTKEVEVSIEKYHAMIEKEIREVIEASEERHFTSSTDVVKTIEKLLRNIDQQYADFLHKTVQYSATNQEWQKRYEEIHRIVERLDIYLDTGNRSTIGAAKSVKPKNAYGWMGRVYNLSYLWIDTHIGIRYICMFFKRLALIAWIISIVTSFFILAENHRLEDTEEKYILLRKECRKYKATNLFVNRMEMVFSDKDEYKIVYKEFWKE